MINKVVITDPKAAELIESYREDGAIFTAYQIAADNCDDPDFKRLVLDWNHAKKAQTPKALNDLTEQLLEYEIIIAADTPEQIATALFLSRVRAYVVSADYREYGEPRLKLIHSSRRDLFLRLLTLGYSLKQSSILLARLEIETAKLNETNISQWTAERLLELIHSLGVRFS